MNDFKDKVIRIYEKSYTSTRKTPHLTYYSPQIEIHSEYYKNSIALPWDIDLKKLLNKETYNAEIQDFLDGEYCFILRNISDEKIRKIINTFPNIPIIVDSTLNFLDRPNIFYSILGDVDISFLYTLLKLNRTFGNPSCYNIVIKNITDEVLRMLKEIESMISDYVLKVYINDANSLLKLDEILNGRENHPTLITFSENLFWAEDLNSYSARYILGNYEIRKKIKGLVLSHPKLSIKYLNIDKIDEIFNFEIIIDTLISMMPSDVGELDKVTFIILFIVNNFKTNLGFRNLYELLKSRSGQCNQFSELVKSLLNHLGIKCEIVGGQSKYNWREGHSWNVVNILGKEYFLDVTWIINEFETNKIQSIEESINCLTDNFCFKICHGDFMSDVNNVCLYYPRREIKSSIARINSWEKDSNSLETLIKSIEQSEILIEDDNSKRML